ncbi:MAG: TetR/AcrR family transcriptional regulator [Chroococcidiopsidaceae cyanobacterium CP_BM_ER_R8_30]|nr:TetR/AcrR family transcriptional regulator [Chroococcidiopsidaceae cyanobacterium CP_BM_ER_R8_30]
MSVYSAREHFSEDRKIAGGSLPSGKSESAKAAALLKREQILQRATRVFLQHGYAGTSMDRVANEAGVSKQTIYSHFQDKKGLFTALLERVTLRQLRAEFGSEPFQGEPDILLRRIAHGYLKKMDDREFIDLLRVVVAESARFPELAQLYTRTVIQPICQGLVSYFKSHPKFNNSDAEAIAQVFYGSLSAFILSQKLLYFESLMPMDNERLVNTLIQLCYQDC